MSAFQPLQTLGLSAAGLITAETIVVSERRLQMTEVSRPNRPVCRSPA